MVSEQPKPVNTCFTRGLNQGTWAGPWRMTIIEQFQTNADWKTLMILDMMDMIQS
jgi:hypothetical protein